MPRLDWTARLAATVGRARASIRVPATVTVPVGATVTWTNSDEFTHNVRLLDDGGGVLALRPGESVSFTFEGVGEHRYDCSFHPTDMTGVVVVNDS